jgi:hypothetical protein
MMIDMIVLIDFKTCLSVEKNSGITGRKGLIRYSKIEEPSSIITSRSIALTDQNTKQAGNSQLLLALVPHDCEKIFLITSRLKK